MSVDLGFVEKCEAWRLESRFFPSKVGGKPAWLDLKNIPGEKDLACDYCKEPCVFLCQVYAPYEEDANAFHRTVYVFVCKRPECCKPNKNGNLKVFRSQLQRVNNFYPSEPPVEEKDWRTDINVNQWAKSCYLCGILAPSHCSKCKATNYCSRTHQVYDWKHGHKEICNGKEITITGTDFLFPEYELVIEREEDGKETHHRDELEKEQQEMEKFNEMAKSGKAGTFQSEDVDEDLMKMANKEEDEIFSKFVAKTEKYPDQVLRYHRGGEILYISSDNRANEIPKCEECNGERQFEFQIMPQLLNFLELKGSFRCIDWGILIIFTCKNSCSPSSGYVREYISKQDITTENKNT